MEQEMTSALEALTSTVERLAAAGAEMEQRFQAAQDAMSGELARVVAQVESGDVVRELERQLGEAQQQIASLQAGKAAGGRKTLPVAAMNLLAKHGVHDLESLEAGAIDGALNGLTIEQRIAVKSHLLRAGLLG